MCAVDILNWLSEENLSYYANNQGITIKKHVKKGSEIFSVFLRTEKQTTDILAFLKFARAIYPTYLKVLSDGYVWESNVDKWDRNEHGVRRGIIGDIVFQNDEFTVEKYTDENITQLMIYNTLKPDSSITLELDSETKDLYFYLENFLMKLPETQYDDSALQLIPVEREKQKCCTTK